MERNLIAEIVVSGVLPVSRAAGGVVGVLDLLLEGRLIGLTSDSHFAVTDNVDNIQRLSVIPSHATVFVLGQIVASRNIIQRSICGEISLVVRSRQVGKLKNLSKLLLIRLRAFNLGQRFGSCGSRQISSIITRTIIGIEISTRLNVTE